MDGPGSPASTALSVVRHTHTLGHLDRAQALRLPKTLESLAELQEQLALQNRRMICGIHMSNILYKSPYDCPFYWTSLSKARH